MQDLFLLLVGFLIGLAAYSRVQEAEWMRRIQDGDEEALRKLYRTYKNIIFGLLLSILNDREEAEDCLQEVFTQVWEKADRFNPDRGKPYSFIVTIARNKAIDRTRSKVYKNIQRQEHTVGDFTMVPSARGNSPYKDTVLGNRAERLREALQQLSEKERTVIQIAYFEGLSQSEIAERTGIPLGTVKYRTRQGMIKLREMLTEED
ncbi:MAG: sigma-70 family RNA polymerase sigma factor [Longimonas sp.]|uniref:sigma-70 family RNA polymerase sigma factor n=1 Tax=Longimonas sp. TaxID=2039626 RepID=UPI003353D53A